MEKVFLRSSAELSLLKEESQNSISINNSLFTKHILNNREFLDRAIATVPAGKSELRKMLDDARKVIFSKDELINWLHKIKQDSESETDTIFIEFEACFGMEASEINFERAGFLAGILKEAERYLNLIIAIEPLERTKPHHSILDRLEKLDEDFVDNDNIPGYYSVQRDARIPKRKYDLKNLDDYWNEYLSLQNRHHIIEGFGNLKHLLSQFHVEFKWDMIQIKPREDIKLFLDYHLKKFKGEPIDFLNHIEFRVMTGLAGLAGSNYLMYQLIIKEWLKDNRFILNQKEQIFLFNSVVEASATFLDNVFLHKKSCDENKYNIIIRDFLSLSLRHKSWSVKDQSMGGMTDSDSKANRAGISSRDLIILNEKDQHISAIECFRLKSVPKDNGRDSDISLHLKKIFRNEPIGISPLFIIVYCETKSFPETWERYLDYISKIDFENYQSIGFTGEIETSPIRANLRVAKVVHNRETKEIEVFHLFINMNP
ncbi:hypothetical protein [Flavobacterium sp. GSB-24]|uniref:hypothetical protein n=1 Tax=Flavobacterium sp. GSB-24 TaxID=2994319 RepID=UPI002491F49A|nr:hypothetical protein [Flavobacterium sp. GSB-24]BDU25153.1 hypothetical protein FLGSB24_18970 [Flavobacterium sp. GSB-24]